jgi:peptide/nickel transport system permease protein
MKSEIIENTYIRFLRRFCKNKMALSGCLILLLMIIANISSPLITASLSVDHLNQSIFNRYKSFNFKEEITASNKEIYLEKYLEKIGTNKRYLLQDISKTDLSYNEVIDEDALYDIIVDSPTEEVFLKLGNNKSSHISLFKKHLKKYNKTHLLGTDELGRDVFMRINYGTQVSLGIGIIVAFIATCIGIFIGVLGGFFGGYIDLITVKITDIFLSLPQIPILIILSAIDLSKIQFLDILISENNEAIVKIIFTLCIFSWMTVARLVRSSVLSKKESQYVLAAKGLGASNLRILLRHIFPNIIGPVLVEMSLITGQAILIEAGLSFLGLGIQPPIPSWGNMLFNAQDLIYEAPQLAFIPGLMIILAVMSFNFIGDGIRDAYDGKSIL